ncbi:MAG: hypothetical protein DK306_000502 [Chloroflexi bacterium]|nr:MAG: hypothetical protein DK306_000502 [Chloroflexota bacterium]
MNNALVEFGSSGWLDALERAFRARVATATPEQLAVPYSMSETYTDPPAGLGSGAALGFHFRIGPTGFEFHRQPADDVDFRIVGSYAAIQELARFAVDDDPARRKQLDGLVASALKAGDMRTQGERSGAASIFAGVHDEVARVTA